MSKICPLILKGTRDFLPEEMIRRVGVTNIIQKIFAQFGYVPIETPILSPAETILGKYGDEGDRLTYSFTDKGGRRIALPYDLTVPFARYVAANYKDLPMPFKRYQIQRVWRAEKPQKGRLREFYQCDIDIIGSRSLVCEAEIAKIIVEVFPRLGITDFIIKINSRRLLNAILQTFNIPENEALSVIRTIDKIEKIGKPAVREELRANGIPDPENILKILEPCSSNEETLKKLKPYNVSEIEDFFRYCEKLSVPKNYLRFDPTLARGLDYYTGLTFEVTSREADFGTICAGGRYDNLCSLFCDEDFSGVGVSFGFERIMMLIEKLNLLKNTDINSQVLVTIFDDAMRDDSLSIYAQLINEGIPSEVYFESDKLAKQFKYADKKQIPFVVIMGPSEKEKNLITIKRMENGKQKTIPANQLISYLKGYYEAK